MHNYKVPHTAESVIYLKLTHRQWHRAPSSTLNTILIHFPLVYACNRYIFFPPSWRTNSLSPRAVVVDFSTEDQKQFQKQKGFKKKTPIAGKGEKENPWQVRWTLPTHTACQLHDSLGQLNLHGAWWFYSVRNRLLASSQSQMWGLKGRAAWQQRSASTRKLLNHLPSWIKKKSVNRLSRMIF